MLRIHLVYPTEDARTAQLRDDLRDALLLLELPPRWAEHDGASPRPAWLAGVTGPAILVEGRPIRGVDGTASARSRILLALQEQLARRDG